MAGQQLCSSDSLLPSPDVIWSLAGGVTCQCFALLSAAPVLCQVHGMAQLQGITADTVHVLHRRLCCRRLLWLATAAD